ncbi:hypothetical protein [Sinomonas sp. P47F7]|uniref:hypothetical protein n=1 Tax=Sinomonas sp. P47F7 TaxID=3410987 RepID=UPI003BF57A86
MAHRLIRRSAALAGAVLVLSGCAAGGVPAAAPAPGTAASSPAAAPSQAPSPGASAGGPSATATMVCGQEIRARIAQILALAAAPAPAPRWADGQYTCTYRLPGGSLVLSVEESADPAAARSGARDAARAVGAAPIEGLANLGLPGYQSRTGTVVFAKDSFTLTVDATGMGEPVGPEGISRPSLAYQIATDVLACWSE